MLWIICCGQHVHIPWVTWVMLWVYAVGTLSSAIWCGLPYAVDDSRPQHIPPVVHSIYMVWVYAVGAHELCRCNNYVNNDKENSQTNKIVVATDHVHLATDKT